MKTVIFLHQHFIHEGGLTRFSLLAAQKLAQVPQYRTILVGYKVSSVIEAQYQHLFSFYRLGGNLASSWYFLAYWPIAFWKLKRLLNTFEEKIIFVQSFPIFWLALVYKFFHNDCPLVWFCHEPLTYELFKKYHFFGLNFLPQKIKARVVQFLIRSVEANYSLLDHIIFDSKKTYKDFLSQHEEVLAHKVSLFKLATHFPARETVEHAHRENIIVFMGYFGVSHHLTHLLWALAQIKERHPQLKFSLYLIGQGEEKERLINQVLQLKLREHVIFTSYFPYETILELLLKSKIYFHGYKEDPYNQTLIDALVFGSTLIGYQESWLSDILVHGESGFLLDESDQDALAQVIEKIFLDQSYFQKIQTASLNRLSKFCWEPSSTFYEQFFDRFWIQFQKKRQQILNEKQNTDGSI